MVKRIIAIAIIFIVTSISWMILGTTIRDRTYSQNDRIYGRIEGLWGAPQTQQAPRISYVTNRTRSVKKENGKEVTVTDRQSHPVTLYSSNIVVNLDLKHRQKGLLWYDTYGVDFSGSYTMSNPRESSQHFTLEMALPSERAIYDKFQLSVNGRVIKVNDFAQERIVVPFDLAPHEPATIVISYHSQGVDTWHYLFGDGINRVENFSLTMTTNFMDIDFPENTLAPTDKSRQGEGWKIHWGYDSLLTGYRLGMDLPNKLNPGPLASSISFFAPVSLLFYFGALFMLSLIRGVRLHPMHYLFLAATFFSFHLLFAYTVDHLPLIAAFILSSAVSLTLAFTYLRLVTGRRFALVEAGLSQMIFLILFSLAHFFAGYTGLTVTIGAIITLAVLMQMTARIDWEQKFRGTC